MEEKKKGILKTFGLTELSLKNQISVMLLTLLLAFAGLFSYFTMPKESYPEIKMPTIYVSTPYPGNSPLDIENLITRPIEKEIKPIKGIKKINSTCSQDYSAIFVEFNPDVEVEWALQEVKDAVDKAKKDLPTDLDQDPSIEDIDFSEFPIMNVNLSGDYSINDLKKYAEYLQDEIEEVDEITRVDLKGALEREINVEVDLYTMQASQISLGDVEGAISSENVNISGGELLVDKNRRTISVNGEFKNAEDIKNIIVKHDKGNIVYLRDIAIVEDGYRERDSYARLNGFPVVSLDVVKKGGQNLLNATDKINEIVDKAKKSKFPADLVVSKTNDQSTMTRSMISNLENSIIMGVILVVVVLLFFLGLRNAMFVGLAIPMSMFISFMVLSAMGITMNFMVLFSLILALGMLVDNAIVAIENIYRLHEKEGYSIMKASRYGIGEIAVPIIASTATTLAAFVPLLFWNDLMGEFMGYIPMTLIIVLASSLFVALVINPVITSQYLKVDDPNAAPDLKKINRAAIILIALGAICHFAEMPALANILITFAALGYVFNYLIKPITYKFQNTFLPKLEEWYKKRLQYALSGWRPPVLLIGTVILLFGSVTLVGISEPTVDFFPVNEPNYINVFVETPIGSDIEATNEVALQVENEVFEIIEPSKQIVESVVANVGKATSDPNQGPSLGSTPNKARITISFYEYQYRDGVSTSDVMKSLSAKIKKKPGVKITVEKDNAGPPVGKPVNIEFVGEDLDKLIAYTEEAKKIIEEANIKGIEQLIMDMELGKPEMQVNINRTNARRLGISTGQIGGTMRTALFGKEVSKFKDGEDDYPIQLRLQDKYRYNVPALMNQLITFMDQSSGRIVQVPISAVASVEQTSTYGSINRKDLDRAITLYSNVIEGHNATIINADIAEVLSDFKMEEGYTFKFTGEQEEQAKSMAFLQTALFIAIALIAMILVSQFNSFTKPFIIVLSILFSTIGVFIGFVTFNMNFVVIMTGIGIVSLAGIVVNNSIVLIDYANLLKKRKKEELGLGDDEHLSFEENLNVVVETGKTRLRPVLLTAITTVLGLMPLATGFNIDFNGLFARFDPNIYLGGDNAIFWGPMAWTVIFGLAFATFLTLVILPVMYLVVDRAEVKVKNLIRPNTQKQSPELQ
ncbi:MAG: efflux RND transporter permease subunit [Bacteroidia bacterium]|nr:efflux RND transporter permease subunit [Bacteroidia bacterium]